MEPSCTRWDPHTDTQPFIAYRSRIYASIFLTVFAKCTSEPQLNPGLRTRQSEAPQSELTLSSMSLLSSTLNFCFGTRLSSAGHRYMTHFNEHRGEFWTIGCTRGSTVELPRSLTTCSRLEMFTLNTWDAFFWHLPLCYFCTHCISGYILSSVYFFFLLCAFVAKRNSSYQEVSCHQH